MTGSRISSQGRRWGGSRALALDALSDRLSALRLQPPQHIATEPGDFEMDATSAFSEQAFYVLDGDLKIVLAWSSEDQRRTALTGCEPRSPSVFPVCSKRPCAG